MTVALYMDEQVPKAITIGLRLRGVDVLTFFLKKSLALATRRGV